MAERASGDNVSGPMLTVTTPIPWVAVVEIDAPPANALGPELYRALDDLVTTLDADADVRAVVFCSAHEKIFVAGADLKRMAAGTFDRPAVLARVDRAHATFLRIQRIGVPTIAAIEGHALGGGCELALALDFRLMTRGPARIGLPEASLGLIPAAGGTQRLPQLVGRARATQMMLLAERLDADEAELTGLVTRACTDARAEALELAERLAAMPASSMRGIKACLNDGAGGDLTRGLAVERTAAAATFVAPEAREGVSAFLEKRPPRFAPPVT